MNFISILLVLLILLILLTLMAVVSSKLLFAAISLAATSILVSILMFMLDSPLAAVFELSICAGLITVIIMTTINFVKPLTHKDLLKTRKRRFKKYVGLPIILAIIGLLASITIKPIALKLPKIIQETNVLNVLWDFRQTDLLGQSILFLIGVFGILVLFREGQNK